MSALHFIQNKSKCGSPTSWLEFPFVENRGTSVWWNILLSIETTQKENLHQINTVPRCVPILKTKKINFNHIYCSPITKTKFTRKHLSFLFSCPEQLSHSLTFTFDIQRATLKTCDQSDEEI